VEDIATSMGEIGQLNPILITEDRRLIAGLHPSPGGGAITRSAVKSVMNSPGASHAALVESDQPAVGDGDAVGVAGEIGKHRLSHSLYELLRVKWFIEQGQVVLFGDVPRLDAAGGSGHAPVDRGVPASTLCMVQAQAGAALRPSPAYRLQFRGDRQFLGSPSRHLSRRSWPFSELDRIHQSALAFRKGAPFSDPSWLADQDTHA
jgi:hypothetical protein